ncbi:hypothetical protein CCACVL1_01064, partial [Corchorus capsularis]
EHPLMEKKEDESRSFELISV